MHKNWVLVDRFKINSTIKSIVLLKFQTIGVSNVGIAQKKIKFFKKYAND